MILRFTARVLPAPLGHTGTLRKAPGTLAVQYVQQCNSCLRRLPKNAHSCLGRLNDDTGNHGKKWEIAQKFYDVKYK